MSVEHDSRIGRSVVRRELGSGHGAASSIVSRCSLPEATGLALPVRDLVPCQRTFARFRCRTRSGRSDLLLVSSICAAFRVAQAPQIGQSGALTTWRGPVQESCARTKA